MNRRQFAKSALVSPLCSSFIVPRRRLDKPSLLFPWTDQQRPDTMKVYGNSVIQEDPRVAEGGQSFGIVVV